MVVYVGNIPNGTAVQYLKDRFSAFGPVLDVQLYSHRTVGNYAYVAYADQQDAVRAVSFPHHRIGHVELQLRLERQFRTELKTSPAVVQRVV